MGITIIIGLLLIYILSGVAWYLSVRYEHTHRFKDIDPYIIDFIVVFIPVVNTVWSAAAWGSILGSRANKKPRYKLKKLIARFFGIKR